VTTIRRAAAVGIALGLGLGAMTPALASSGRHGRENDHGPAWGLDINGDDGPAWGLDNTHHGPAFGTPAVGAGIHLPVVLDGEGPLAPSAPAWANGVSAFGIDGATITGDNPVADAYLGQPGFNSTDHWMNDRKGWLGGLLGDGGWRVGSFF
jgi:hypothetical protein